MTRDPRYDILFEPVRIGPVVARNRFYQVPHCNGMGWRDPSALAAMRGMKAEGGWAVVCTEMTEIHQTADEKSPRVIYTFAEPALFFQLHAVGHVRPSFAVPCKR